MSTQAINALGTALLLFASAWRIRRQLFQKPMLPGQALPPNKPSATPVIHPFSTEHLQCYITVFAN